MEYFARTIPQGIQNSRSHPTIAGVAANDFGERFNFLLIVKVAKAESQLIADANVRVTGKCRKLLPELLRGRTGPGRNHFRQSHGVLAHDSALVAQRFHKQRRRRCAQTIESIQRVHSRQL